jgi:enoyl-CoA hydratase
MEFSFITVQTVNLIEIVTLNRPNKLNALNIDLLTELNSVLDATENNRDIKCLIITGSGEKAFAAGADIGELKNMEKTNADRFSKFGQDVFNRISTFNKPIIAAINGYALGGGFELALACHLRFASENAKFGLPEINLGVIPGYGGTQRLTELINKNRAAELILTGSFIDAEEAYRLGIVNKIYPLSKLMNKSLEFAELVSSKSQIAISAALNSIFSFNKDSFNNGLKIESNQFFNAVNSNDFDEGTAAFLEKRKPNFKDQ